MNTIVIETLNAPASINRLPVGDAGSGHPAPTGQISFTARWIQTIDDLEAIVPAWAELAQKALWTNPAFESNYLIPAFKYLNDVNAKVLLIEAGVANQPREKRIACGLLPLFQQRFYGLPLKCINVWKHLQCFDGTPLIHRDCAPETIDFLFSFLSDQGCSLFHIDTLNQEPDVERAWQAAITSRSHKTFVRESFERAALIPVESPDIYMSKFTSKSARKNVKRLRRRLEEQGTVAVELANQNSDFEKLTDEFLALEKSGWKGQSNTALASSIETENFYRELVQRSAAANKARFLTIRLDGKPIAMISDLISNHQVCSYKVAYDESFSDYSPGLQNELNNIESIHREGVQLVDSCTAPDNAAINRIWGQRIKFQNLVISLKPGLANWATSMMPSIQKFAHKIKSLLKRSR